MKIRKIILAVNPFDKSRTFQSNAEKMLRLLSEKTKASIQPVYVLSPTQLNISFNVKPTFIHQYLASSEKALYDYVDQLDLPNLKQPQVLHQAVASKTETSKALIDYAINQQADVILLNTHGRSGINRVVLGSFAESLLLHSPIPILLLGSQLREVRPLHHILLPSDFRDSRKMLLKQAVQIAQLFDSKLTLFHAITQPTPSLPILDTKSFPPWPRLGSKKAAIASVLAAEREDKLQTMNHWMDWARSKGVRTDLVIDSRVNSISEGIISLATKRKVDLIVMAAQSGPVEAALLGSVTRGVIRGGPCPVWILRPSARIAMLSSERENVQSKAA